MSEFPQNVKKTKKEKLADIYHVNIKLCPWGKLAKKAKEEAKKVKECKDNADAKTCYNTSVACNSGFSVFRKYARTLCPKTCGVC